MPSPSPWRAFRSLAIVSLMVVLMLTVIWLCLKTSYYSPFHQPFEVWWPYLLKDSIFGILSFGWIVLPPVVLLLVVFVIGARFHLPQYIIARYGYQYVGAVTYAFVALEFFLVRITVFGYSYVFAAMLINFILSFFPGLVLLVWRGSRNLIVRLQSIRT